MEEHGCWKKSWTVILGDCVHVQHVSSALQVHCNVLTDHVPVSGGAYTHQCILLATQRALFCRQCFTGPL